MLVGAVDGEDRAAWRAVQRLGRAPVREIARSLELAADDTRALLDRLSRRRLLVEEGSHYSSLRHALAHAGEREGRGF